MDPERVRKLHEKLLAKKAKSPESWDEDVVGLASKVRTYRRRINGKTVQVGGYDRDSKKGAPPTGPQGGSAAAAVAKAILSKYAAGQKVSSSDRTKSHQRIVQLLMRENSPLVQSLKAKMAKGNMSAEDLKREYERIAILFLRAYQRKGAVKATSTDDDTLELAQIKTFRRVSKTGKVGYVRTHDRATKPGAPEGPGRKPGKVTPRPMTSRKTPNISKSTGLKSESADKSGQGDSNKASKMAEVARSWAKKLSQMDEEQLRKALIDAMRRRQGSNAGVVAQADLIARLAILEMRRRKTKQKKNT